MDDAEGVFFGAPDTLNGSGTIRFAKRESDSGLGSPAAVALPGLYLAGTPTLTADRLTLFVNGNRERSATVGIFRAERADPSDLSFADPTPIHPDGGAASEYARRVNGDELWYSKVVAGGKDDLFRRAVFPDGGLGEELAVSSLNTSSNEVVAVVTRDGLRVYFASDRSSAGDHDIGTAERSTTAAPFTNARRVPELSTSAFEAPSWISPDGCSLLLSTSRPPTPDGDRSMYIARKPP